MIGVFLKMPNSIQEQYSIQYMKQKLQEYFREKYFSPIEMIGQILLHLELLLQPYCMITIKKYSNVEEETKCTVETAAKIMGNDRGIISTHQLSKHWRNYSKEGNRNSPI